jgi:hypothetical protein
MSPSLPHSAHSRSSGMTSIGTGRPKSLCFAMSVSLRSTSFRHSSGICLPHLHTIPESPVAGAISLQCYSEFLYFRMHVLQNPTPHPSLCGVFATFPQPHFRGIAAPSARFPPSFRGPAACPGPGADAGLGSGLEEGGGGGGGGGRLAVGTAMGGRVEEGEGFKSAAV